MISPSIKESFQTALVLSRAHFISLFGWYGNVLQNCGTNLTLELP